MNADDQFFNFFKIKAEKKRLRIISFGIKSNSNLRLIKIRKEKNKSILFINFNNSTLKFSIKKSLVNYIYNILSTLAVISVHFEIQRLNKYFFNDYKFPEGRGDVNLINFNGKRINLIDESYNSNPYSLKFALNKLNNLNANSKRKLILLGDMLELGKHSKNFKKSC